VNSSTCSTARLQHQNGIRQIEKSADSSFSQEERKRDAVRDQLEALILQMYKSNILYSEAVREFKKRFILTVLQENNGNQCRAARQLGMHRNTLSRTISELKIDIRQLRAGVKRPPRSARPVVYDKKAIR
jgi:Fis family transcriptional regulator